MTTTREHLLQAVRGWLKLANSLTDAQVIPADDKGPRPPLPYLTVKVTSADIPIGEDARTATLAETVEVTDGAEGDTYTLTVNDEDYTYVRLIDDTDADVATALAALIVAADDGVHAEASAAVLTVSRTSAEALVVEVTAGDLELAADTLPAQGAAGTRRANVSVNGYGDGAEAWLETARRRLPLPSIVALNDANGVTVTGSGLTDLSGLLDTEIEARHLLEVELAYAFVEAPETGTAFDSASVSYTGSRGSADASPLTRTLTAEA